MQGFYSLPMFGLLLIYILKVYCKKPCSILLRKDMFNSVLTIFFWKSLPAQVLKLFSAENLETTPNNFLSKFSPDIYLSRIINYWGSIFTFYVKIRAERSLWLAFYPYFFSFFLLFFPFSVFIFLDRH